MTGSDVLVVVPHSGVSIPPEISLEDLTEDFTTLLKNVDWFTQWLYDFRDILGNRQLVFPYCSILLDANRDPADLDECVPVKDVFGRQIYHPAYEPSTSMRSAWSDKYLKPFHRSIEENIAAGAGLIFDGHSTITARGVADNQIDLMNFQKTPGDDKPLYYCPDLIVETYADELRRRLPDVVVTINASEYIHVHGHICAAHCINSLKRTGARAPAFIQETNERLFRNADGTPDVHRINRLRRAFAESLAATLQSLLESEKVTMIDLHIGKQIYDYDCGVQALMNVMTFYGAEVDREELIETLGTTEESGTPPQAMIAAAQKYGFEVQAGTQWPLSRVKQFVGAGTPVIVLLQAWADRYMTLDDWRRDWDDGHYAIVIGFSKDVLLFEDPATIRRTWLREREFLARWHDLDAKTGEKYEHFGMVLLGRQPARLSLEHMD